MNKSILILALFGALGLSACDKQPTVVNVPPAPAPATEPVPGPPGPSGQQGAPGEAGKTGDGSTVIVVPPPSAPASAPAN